MAENYVLKIKVDDTDLRKLEKRLAAIMTGKTAGSGSSGSSGGANATATKNLVKLGLIATGIGGLLAITKKLTSVLIDSSPMLQQILKLLNFSIMLIFRPIGDFIGFLLRPVIIFLLRKFIIPWYKDVYPVMKALGTTIGGAVTDLLGDVSGENGINGVIGAIGKLALGGVITVAASVTAAKVVGRLWKNVLISTGKTMGLNMGSNFNSKVNKGAVANLKQVKPSGLNRVANKIISAFRMFNRLKFPTIPKPTWLVGFDTTVNKLVNLVTGKSGTGGSSNKSPTSGIGGKKSPYADVFGKSSGFGSKTKLGGKTKFGGFSGKTGGGGTVGKGLTAIALWDLLVSPGDLGGWLPQTGAEGDVGYQNISHNQELDFLSTSQDVINGVLNGIASLLQQQSKPSVVYNTITDKTTADYMSSNLQGGWNK